MQACVFMDSRAVYTMQQGNLEGVPVVYTPRREPLRLNPYHLHVPAWVRLRAPIRAFQPDVVHGFGTQGQNGILAVTQGKPSVVSIQGIVAKDEGLWRVSRLRWRIEKQVEHFVVRKATVIIAKTPFAREWVLSLRPGARVFLIPNALQPEFLNVRPGYAEPLALCIGDLTPRKAPDMAIRAFASATRGKAGRLVFAGTGPEEAACRALASQLGIARAVEFLGQVSHETLSQWMSRARLLVLASRFDVSPNAVTEAHTAGLPVVATRVGGTADMVEPGVDGLLVDRDDVEAMSGRMAELLWDPKRCGMMGAAGREKVCRLHDPRRIAQLHLDAYRAAVALRSSPPQGR